MGRRIVRPAHPFTPADRPRPGALGLVAWGTVTQTIQVMADALADQIAAGEVVERPASVVKELLENALDAQATRITVEMENGGRTRICVTDNGVGMSPEDATLCVQRHATSKLSHRDQLFSIGTLGFRGEALPSIASVSDFELRTRTSEAVAGTRVAIAGGAPGKVSEVGCPSGTTVVVRDLFYNVPARLKFLRTKATESGQIAAVCLRVALCHPELQLTLTRDGRTARTWLKANSFAERVRAAFPGETLTSVAEDADGMRIEAVLGPPERARSGAAGLHLFINGRPIRDTSLARAVAFAYGSVLPPGRYPIGALRLALPLDEVDVNVHPQKSEVRLREGRRRFDALTRTLAKGLGLSAWRGPAARSQSYWTRNLPGHVRDPIGGAEARIEDPGQELPTGPEPSDPWGLGAVVEPREPSRAPAGDQPSPLAAPTQTRVPTESKGYFASMRVIGQVRRMFLVCEASDGLHILDQHAADERVRYDQLRKSYKKSAVKTQALLFPERIACSEREANLVETHRDEISSVGLDCALLGPDTVAVRAVPALLRRASPERLLRDLLGELEGHGDRTFGDAVDMALATMACHAAIRAGDYLAPDEMQTLLANLDAIDEFGSHCPHGRPVALTVPFSDLERRLGR